MPNRLVLTWLYDWFWIFDVSFYLTHFKSTNKTFITLNLYFNNSKTVCNLLWFPLPSSIKSFSSNIIKQRKLAIICYKIGVVLHIHYLQSKGEATPYLKCLCRHMVQRHNVVSKIFNKKKLWVTYTDIFQHGSSS